MLNLHSLSTKRLRSGNLTWVAELSVPGGESPDKTFQLQRNDQPTLAFFPAVLDESSVPAVTVFVSLSSNPISPLDQFYNGKKEEELSKNHSKI